jgi:AcrR family transcriptional regulator
MTTIRPAVQPTPATETELGAPSERSAAPDERMLREERLLDVASALLVRWGYRKTTIDDVAREAGVGKGTIYLHWKDKNALFRAAIWRALQRYKEDVQRRVAADPEGGLLHRLVTHSMLASQSNPLLAAIIRGRSDIFNGFLGAHDAGFLPQLIGDADEYFVQLQQAGLIRADLSVPTISYLLTALKIGVINASDLLGSDQLPPLEELTKEISDLIRRWLEPEHLPGASDAGKALWAGYLERMKEPD